MTPTRASLTNYAYVRGLTMAFLFFAASGIMGSFDHFILRMLICAVASYGAGAANALRHKVWALLLGASAVVFNPFWHPHHLGHAFWTTMDITVALILGASLFALKPPKPSA